MSGSISSLTSAANAAAASVASAAGTQASSTGSATAAIGSTALQQLGSNFNSFLSLLTTQLQNQDPTQPMNTDQFTSELVQFTGVQQEVATNTNLSQLIALQQTSQMEQSAGLIGHPVTVSAQQITLQNGSGEITFQGQAGRTAAIAIVDGSGTPIRDLTMAEQSGTNRWSWDGTDNSGNAVANGAYNVAVEQQVTGGAGAPTALTFSVVGTATGLSSNGTTSQLALGALTVPFSSVLSVGQ